MGATTYSIARSFFNCDVLGITTIYYFPTDSDVKELSQGRMRPIIQSSPPLREIVPKDHVDSVHLKKIGRGMLYIRGLKSKMRKEAVPADFLIFDEADIIPLADREHAEHRLDHSKYKWKLELSKPSLPNMGIDQSFKESDQRFWMVKCVDNHYNCIEDNWPNIVKKRKNNEGKDVYFLGCMQCGKKLDIANGVWVPKCPDLSDRKVGFHLCQLISPRCDLRKLWEKWEKRSNIKLFYNADLGLPYVEPRFALEREQIFACCGNYDNKLSLYGDERDEKGNKLERQCVAGIDHDKQIYIVIYDVLNKQVVSITRVDDFNSIDKVLERFNVKLCVCDNMPNIMEVRKLKTRMRGHVFSCTYSDSQTGAYEWNKRLYTVAVNRTESMDESQIMLEGKLLSLPRKSREVIDFVDHAMNVIKNEVETDKGSVVWTYQKLGPDHYRHAFNYAMVAASFFKQRKRPGVIGYGEGIDIEDQYDDDDDY